MATITPQAANARTGTAPVAASAGGDTLAMGSAQRCVLNIVNGSASAITVTLTGVTACNLGSLHNVVITCAASQTTPIGISVNDPATAACITSAGNVAIGYSAVTTVTVFATTS